MHGSGISLGHPVGATGARILTTLLREMERRGARYGLETMCIGGGQGMRAVFRTSRRARERTALEGEFRPVRVREDDTDGWRASLGGNKVYWAKERLIDFCLQF